MVLSFHVQTVIITLTPDIVKIPLMGVESHTQQIRGLIKKYMYPLVS